MGRAQDLDSIFRIFRAWKNTGRLGAGEGRRDAYLGEVRL